MIEQIKAGDKLTVIKVNSLASTSINEITIDCIHEGKPVFVSKRKKYYLSIDNNVLVIKGHNLGITQGTWNDGGSCFIMDANCNIGGLDRESMIELLQTNINPQFDQWQKIHWFDGTSDEGDPIFVPRPATTNYLLHREEAETNNAKTAGEINVGDFIYSCRKGSQHNNLNDMLKYHLATDTNAKEVLELGKIAAIVDIDEEAFDSLRYMDNCLELAHSGGSCSDDLDEDRDATNLSKFELETLYTLLTLIRTPSGRAITVDTQGYDYMRYTGLLSHYKTSMAADCAKAQELLRADNEEVMQNEQAKTMEAEAEKTHIETEYSFLTVATENDCQKTAANNLRTLLKHKFPTTRFSVKKHYYDSYVVEWNDGPTDSAVREITRLFKNQGFDGMTDSSYPINSPFIDRYGGIGSISTSREISQSILDKELELLNKELDKRYKPEDYVVEKGDIAFRVVYKIAHTKDYSPALEPESKASVAVITAEGIEIIDYSEKAFAVVGNTKPIKDTLKQLGGSFNGRLSCGAGWIFSKSKMETVKQTLSLV